MKTLFDHIVEAHSLSGAPGRVTGFWGDGRYNVQLQYGTRKFRFKTHGPGDCRVTVYPSWSIDGQRQKKQATSTWPSLSFEEWQKLLEEFASRKGFERDPDATPGELATWKRQYDLGKTPARAWAAVPYKEVFGNVIPRT